MAFIAGITLIQPGTVLDRMWTLNRRAYDELVPIAIQVFADFLNVVRGRLLHGGAGIAIAGALLIYILRPNIRAGLCTLTTKFC
jgi:hypothetical protein